MPAQRENQEDINIKELVAEAFKYKYLYISCILFCFIVAFFYNKYAPVVYEVNSLIQPTEENRTSLLASKDLFSGLGGYSQTRNIENDISSLKSFSLVSNTIQDLGLDIGFFLDNGKIFEKPKQVYRNFPVTVAMDKSHLQPIGTRFYIEIIDSSYYRLTASEEGISLYNYIDNEIISREDKISIDTICAFNETIDTYFYKFSVSLNKEILTQNSGELGTFFFVFYHLDNITKSYLNRLTVEQLSANSSLLNIRFSGGNLALDLDFLNSFIQTYLDENLAKKNRIAVNTISFIDNQISEVSDSLSQSQSQLRDFRSANLVTDLSYQGQRALEQMNQIESDRARLQVQERYYNYILDYFDKNQDISGLATPAAANVNDPIMNSLILELLALNSERSTILSNNADKNLFLGQIENNIRLQKQAIIENVKNNLNTLSLTYDELDYREEKLSREIYRLPRTELNMVSMQRKFDLNDAIITYLLEKRSEAAITMASNYPDYEILEPARSITMVILSPKSLRNWIIALFLGLFIPSAYLILKNFFNERISTVKEAENILNRSVLSLIYSNEYKTDAIVQEKPRSAIAESYRNLRTKLLFRLRSNPEKVILITSSQPRDGKSFIAYNLAVSIASVGHKVIIVDSDMRKPTLHSMFHIDNGTGLSNYMTDHTSEKEIIHKTDVDNLSFIPAGPLLPNSAELLQAGALDKMIAYLKENYDYIIIDSTPAGIVADASIMVSYASHVLLICRNNSTRKDVFSDLINSFRDNDINNFDVVFNDMILEKSKLGRYNAYYKKE